ncbi:hypothetical protein [Paenibacillus cymbidii]|uniref:hypothetical protein n=1 Tax=Paenibacillus cymbidii TaxID=1639034 RepID=UPI00108027BD|nr:hypothetical protein [Paenibacillus cymbidii]
MAYNETTWVDRAVQFPNRYSKSGESVGQVTLVADPGTVTEAGTPINAARLNNIEDGVLKAAIFGTIYAYRNLGGGL